MGCIVQIMTMNAFIYTYAHIKFFLFVDEKLGKKKKGKLCSYLLSALAKYTTFCHRSNECCLRKYFGNFVSESLFLTSVGGTAESSALEKLNQLLHTVMDTWSITDSIRKSPV